MPHDSATLEALCRPHERYMYGQPHTVEPRLVSHVFGDGEQLCGVCPIATRPDYYVVRIDSRWQDFNDDEFRDFMHEVYDAIEDDYGRADCDQGEDGEECEPDCDKHRKWFPYFDFSVGVDWFHIDERQIAEAIRDAGGDTDAA